MDIAISMPLWRALDPAPIDWLELQPDPLDSVRSTHDLMASGGFSQLALPAYEERYLQDAACGDRALAAVERHWIAIRVLHASNALGASARLYLTWMDSVPFLQAHPTLGSVAGKLMAHCHQHFSAVVAWPGTEQQIERELAAFNLHPTQWLIGGRIVLSASESGRGRPLLPPLTPPSAGKNQRSRSF
ncbi:hypothetical protein [Inhella sp.]|uniref:hypothetical protein n=1 Tax=Inhella sp. TaxID=1921806 RepID=UPI0035B12947